MSEKCTKRFGLIVVKKKTYVPSKPVAPAAGCVFGDSDDDEDVRYDAKKPTTAGSSQSLNLAKAVRLAAQAEDPTVFQYDEVYDTMKASTSKGDQPQAGDVDEGGGERRKPKYMAAVINAANKRQREQEARIERKAKREREEEGNEFDGSEVFVTGAYREKMEELRKHEEQERKEEVLNEMTSGVKHKHMAGFYRHLFSQQLQEETIVAKKEPKAEPVDTDAPPVAMKKPVQDLSKGRRYRPRKSNQDEDSDSKNSDSEQAEISPPPIAVKREHSPDSLESRRKTPRRDDNVKSKSDKEQTKSKVDKEKSKNIYFSESPESSPPEETPPPSPGLKIMKERHDSPVHDVFDVEESKIKRLELLKKHFERHNNEKSIKEYKERYFERHSNAVVSVG